MIDFQLGVSLNGFFRTRQNLSQYHKKHFLRRILVFVGLNFCSFLVANSKKTTNISHN